MAKIKTIGILTSGGDAPGMNAAIRAVTRAGIYNGFKIKGIYRGYEGLIHDEVKEFTTGYHYPWWNHLEDSTLERFHDSRGYAESL